MPLFDPSELSLIEALHSTPSRRYLSTEPIPDDVLWAILDAAVRGPTGGNRQAWGWVVVSDEAVKQRIAQWYREGWQQAYGNRRAEILASAAADTGMSRRAFLAAEYLAEHLEDAPVWVFPVLRNAADSNNPRLGSSIYGAVQQLILAARAHGVGTTLNEMGELLIIGGDNPNPPGVARRSSIKCRFNPRFARADNRNAGTCAYEPIQLRGENIKAFLPGEAAHHAMENAVARFEIKALLNRTLIFGPR